MKIVQENEGKSISALAHRPGGVHFTSLLQGKENSEGNYHLTLVHAQDYHAVRHRHNFDQVRIVLEGAFGFDEGQVQEAGTVGYFTEGTFYTQAGVGTSTTLLLQAGGASGHGYMSIGQLSTAVDQLSTKGVFENGVFSWLDAGGKKHNKDGYEAAWEHVNGHQISYSRPRFLTPVILQPNNFAWLSTGQDGVYERIFGKFTERELILGQIKIGTNTRAEISAEGQETLLFLAKGAVQCRGQEMQRYCAVQIEHDETIELETEKTEAIFYMLRLMKRQAMSLGQA